MDLQKASELVIQFRVSAKSGSQNREYVLTPNPLICAQDGLQGPPSPGEERLLSVADLVHHLDLAEVKGVPSTRSLILPLPCYAASNPFI